MPPSRPPRLGYVEGDCAMDMRLVAGGVIFIVLGVLGLTLAD